MRLSITLEDRIVHELDRRAGPGERSAFIEAAVRRALDNEARWELIESAIGYVDDRGHAWDADPATWVADQRRASEHRVS